MHLRDYNRKVVREFAAAIAGEDELLSVERTRRMLDLLDDKELQAKFDRWRSTGKTEGDNRKATIVKAKAPKVVRVPLPPDFNQAPIERTPDTSLQAKVDRNRAIVEDYKNGVPSTKLAEKYKISRERVCQIIRPYGVIEDRMGERLALQIARYEARKAKREARRQKTIDALEMVKRDNISLAEAAIRVGLNRGQMYSDTKKLQLAHSGLSSHGRWSRNWTERNETIERMRREGASWDEINRHFGMFGLISHAKKHLPHLWSQEELEIHHAARAKLSKVIESGVKKPPALKGQAAISEVAKRKNAADLLSYTEGDPIPNEDTLENRVKYFQTLKEEEFTSSEIALMAQKKFNNPGITRNTVLGVLFRDKVKNEKEGKPESEASKQFFTVAEQADKGAKE